MRVCRSRRVRLTALGFLALCLAVAGASMAARQDAVSTDSDALKQRLQRIQRQQQRTLTNLRAVKHRQRRVNRELREIDRTLSLTEARLGEVTRDVGHVRAGLALAVKHYRAAQRRLNSHRQSVSDRLVSIYELGEVRPVEVLLQSVSFADFANRLYLLNLAVQRDAELLGQFEQAQTAADQHRANVAAEERRLSALQGRISAQKERVSDWREATADKRDHLLAARAEYERQLAELEQNSREVTAMLQRLERTHGGRARLATPWRGGLVRPVPGKVTSGFGYRTHPIYHVRKLHTGMDIAAPLGTPVQAAAGGVVVFAGWWGGYGNCVIIDHGGGLATLYGHCSSLSVSEGESVRQGQTIAAVGSTGLSTGPHLHFETRRNGRPVDPQGF